ncbi:LssY C-terminal domain-containing protein [Hyphomicrobium sp. 99]|uniref:LssY C-terminal domain-containing protein n=1 Tax=Hyphomicrobium sp. 99 TaxID=1163419 RepID=UPI0005F85003|nr:LssY C-terminal domain-containing protein [Hyphomicrobium sp. 99]
MRLAIRTLQRIAIFGLGVLSVWLIVDVFELVDRRLPWILAVSATYIIGAYLILPRAVRMGLKILQRQHVPSFTITGDGLPGDPVNLALAGTATQLRSAFASAGWVEADPLNIASSWRMVQAFVLNTSYPAAPFSTLYLFGRGQDIGFQKAIDNSPRKRHHVRFWAQSLANAETDWSSAAFWLNDERPADDQHVLWVGAGTKDTGLSLTRLTFQMTHATDSDTNAERNYIVEELSQCGVIGKVTNYQTGDELITKHVNHYITDGDIAVAEIETTSLR